MRNKALAAAVAASLGMTTGTADAAVYSATLTQALTYSPNSPYGSACNFSSSTATWTYDDVSGVLTQTSGEYNLRVSSGPSTLYRTSITGLVIGNGQLAAANSYVCTEGNFGATVGASICGNYCLGGNYIDESTTSWGPGTAYSRTLGGDDYAAGTPQNLDRFHGMTAVSFAPGGTLVLTNKSCTSTCPTGGYNSGHQWAFGNLQLIEDADGDAVVDVVDNCTQVANPGQCDSDGDGYGNHCDADLNCNVGSWLRRDDRNAEIPAELKPSLERDWLRSRRARTIAETCGTPGPVSPGLTLLGLAGMSPARFMVFDILCAAGKS